MPVLIEDGCGDYDQRKHEWAFLNYGRQQQIGDGLYGRTTQSDHVIAALEQL